MFWKINQKRLLKDDSHSWDKLTMRASHIKRKDSNLTLNFFFEISKFAILLKKKLFRKKFKLVLWPEKYRSISKENTDQFCVWKKFRFTSMEDTDLFCVWQKFRSISKEDIDQFCI